MNHLRLEQSHTGVARAEVSATGFNGGPDCTKVAVCKIRRLSLLGDVRIALTFASLKNLAAFWNEKMKLLDLARNINKFCPPLRADKAKCLKPAKSRGRARTDRLHLSAEHREVRQMSRFK